MKNYNIYKYIINIFDSSDRKLDTPVFVNGEKTIKEEISSKDCDLSECGFSNKKCKNCIHLLYCISLRDKD